ncbi:MAG: SpoIIE family protein phosphatase [Bacteroidetes bacterium]|nr:SpoIIE family protein phosphatase [Bacteroidota bacterium]
MNLSNKGKNLFKNSKYYSAASYCFGSNVEFNYLSLLNQNLVEKEIVEKQKKDITDSIRYAKEIQKAILPSIEEMEQVLPNSFILFKPKDIVSGDFYWFSKVDQKIVIAAADCTGHGVPGAFMSMIGTTLMNEIINEKQNTDPAAILNQLHAAVIDALKQNDPDAESQDGMDIALCCIDLKSKFIRYAGAMNPLYVVHNGSLDVIKADIKSIGGKIHRHHIETERKFTNHQIPIHKGMTIYVFSDGYSDQYGGEEKKKFGSQKFKQLLLDNSNLDMQKQKDALSKTISEWQALADQPGKSCKQIDDMLVMGVRF